VQLLCVVVVCAFGLVCGYLQMLALDKLLSGGVRVSKRDEEAGLDKSEHNLIQIRVSRHTDGLDLSESDSDSAGGGDEPEGDAAALGSGGADSLGDKMDSMIFRSGTSDGSIMSGAADHAGGGGGLTAIEAKAEANLIKELEDKQGRFASFLLESGTSARSVGTAGGRFSPSRFLRGMSSAFSDFGSSVRNMRGQSSQYDSAAAPASATVVDDSSTAAGATAPAIRTAYGSGGIYYGSKARSAAGGSSRRKGMAMLLANINKASHTATVKEMRSAQTKMAKQLLRLTAEMILERTQDDIAWVPIEKLSQFQENYSAVSTANGAHSKMTVEQMHPSVKKLQDHARKQHQMAKEVREAQAASSSNAAKVAPLPNAATAQEGCVDPEPDAASRHASDSHRGNGHVHGRVSVIAEADEREESEDVNSPS